MMMVAKPSPSLIALKPRQIVLSSNSTNTMKNKASASAAQSLNPHQRSLLLLSVADFLQRNSFSKTLKKFLSEAQIQKNYLTGSSLYLEEICRKYLAMSDHSKPNLSREQFQDVQANDNLSRDGQVGSEDTTKKKTKGGDQSSKTDDKSANSKKSEEEVSHVASDVPTADIIGQLQLDESAKKQKEKKKKKSKLDTESHAECLGKESEKSKDAVPTESNEVSDGGIDNKNKDKKKKKKKKNKLTSDSYDYQVKQHDSEIKQQAVTNAGDISLEEKTSKFKAKMRKKDDSEELEKENLKEDSITDGKSSKKRKRLDSVVHDSQPVDENAIEDSKRRKTESSEEQYSKLNSSAAADKHVSEESNGVSGELAVNDVQKEPAKQLNELENGNIEKNVKNSEQKSSKKQKDNSAEPKKFFQRVNVDEVVFVDKRLEDNSYWAKHGAETGYGAKAQEVLGQVRGRDFRHEKTKKKRGSYRGGQIDMHSHSIKFNYSDDE